MPCGFVFAVRRILSPPVNARRCFEDGLKVDPKLFTALSHDTRISNGAFRVWHILYGMTGNNRYCWPSIRTLAKRLNASTRSVIDWLAELKEFGYVKVVNGGRHTSNRYAVNPKIPKGVVEITTPVADSTTPVAENSTLPVVKTATQLNSGNQNQEEKARNSSKWIKQLREAVSGNL